MAFRGQIFGGRSESVVAAPDWTAIAGVHTKGRREIQMARVLVSDPIAQEGIDILKKAADVDVKTGMPKEELISIIKDYDALAVRSETKVTADVLAAAKNLKIIGRAGVGVDNIDVPEATRRGVMVVNSPGGNTIAAAELTMALLMAMARNIPAATASLQSGEWKRSKFVGVELYSKTLGVVGFGKIGREVAKRSLAFGMEVIATDPFLSEEAAARAGVKLVELDDLIRRSDIITLHLPKNPQTANLIGDAQFAMMKDGVRIVNCARGGIVDEAALAKAIESGKVAGAAIDVYSSEPPAPDNPLIGLARSVTTPHLGASTEEAQINVAIDVAEQIVDVLAGRPARSAVNMPSMSPDEMSLVAPYMRLAEAMGTLAVSITEGGGQMVECSYFGDIARADTNPITRAALVGFLNPSTPENVNYVNSLLLAESRGVRVEETRSGAHAEYMDLMTVKFTTDRAVREISGTVFGRGDIRITSIDGFAIDVVPQGRVIVSEHEDKPGIIGSVGQILGSHKINIAGMHVGRQSRGQRAVMVLSVDDPVPADVMKKLEEIEGLEKVRLVEF